jgi:acetyltransferase-like isoleucine patch superfamily enzyme
MKNWLYRLFAVHGPVEIGRRFHIGPGSRVWAPRKLDIGDDVYVGKWCTIEVDGRIGDGTLIANSVGIVGRLDHNFREVGVPISRAMWVGDAPDKLSRPVIIGADVWIGYGAVVLSGVSIGDSAIVAAGAVVRSDVPANAIVAGNPSVVIGMRFEPLHFDEHWRRLSSHGLERTAP